jgi:pyrroloquinoline quinone (PQQ) biosynthesis protein C
MNHKQELLALYDEFPFERHPMWTAVLRGELSYEEVIRAEVQHWLRTKVGQTLRKDALGLAKVISAKIFEQLIETYLEECTNHSGPSHLELIERLVLQGGYRKADLDRATNTPGNAAAIAIYRDITNRGAGCHMLGAGTVEHFYSQLSPRIFEAYTTHYGMSADQAETYRIHGPMDASHAERAFSIIDEAVSLHGWETVKASVRDAFVATSLHYDGMLQAATGKPGYWDGRATK